MEKNLILSALFCIVPFLGMADSPLTSTGFASFYKEIPIISKAAESDGTINQEHMDYLAGNNPVDRKLALINQLGWDINGKDNARLFRNYLNKRYSNIMQAAGAEELICLAYLEAMDDYFQVDAAIPYAEKAVAKAPESFSVQLIAALIKAQNAMEADWCKSYQLIHRVQSDTSLQMDMRKEAAAKIFNYMNAYKAYCD